MSACPAGVLIVQDLGLQAISPAERMTLLITVGAGFAVLCWQLRCCMCTCEPVPDITTHAPAVKLVLCCALRACFLQ